MEDSSASGIYYCVASNKVGEEERSIEFYVSGKHRKRHCTKLDADDLISLQVFCCC